MAVVQRTMQFLQQSRRVVQGALFQQTRNTTIVKRFREPNLRKPGQEKALKRREYVYIEVDNSNTRPMGDMEILLTRDVFGYGFKGDTITVSKRKARNYFLPSGAATYVTPENLQKYAEPEKGKVKQTVTGQRVVRHLQNMLLPIPMNPENKWVLNTKHVRVAFRQAGFEIGKDCIEIPDEPITEPGPITVNVTVNNIDTVPVQAEVYHHYTDGRPNPTFRKLFSVKKILSEAVLENAPAANSSKPHSTGDSIL